MREKLFLALHRDNMAPIQIVFKGKITVDFTGQKLLWNGSEVILDDKLCSTYEEQMEQIRKFFEPMRAALKAKKEGKN